MKHTTKRELLELFFGDESYSKSDLIQLAKQGLALLALLTFVSLLS